MFIVAFVYFRFITGTDTDEEPAKSYVTDDHKSSSWYISFSQ